MKFRSLFIDSDQEVIVKVVKEVLNLFKIENDPVDPDVAKLSVYLEKQLAGKVVKLQTVLLVSDLNGDQHRYSFADIGREDELERASVHRLVKLNLYHIFRQYFNLPAAPWGILHGVRPTKIVHRFINRGLSRDEVIDRLTADYEVSREKATYITELAYRQLPFLAKTDDKLISIYVGIPYCLSRCLYCSFPAYVLPKEKELAVFMAAFRKDVQAVVEAVRKYDFKIQSIYVGGGTPTSLPDKYFAEMLNLVYASFYGPETIEFTVEAGRPDSMSPHKIQTLVDCKVSRVSVNPQTMQARTLKRIGRNHTPADIIKMYHDLRDAGIPQINMDLIIGLPGETAVDVADTMQQLKALRPDDITLHSLALKRGSILKMQLADYELPGDEEAIKMFDTAMQYITDWGLKPYYLYRQGYQIGQLENVGCCREGAESMYNIQIMEERQTIIGVGGSATTKVVFPETKRLKAVFTPKELSIYLRDTDVYIEKRAALLAVAYNE